MRNNELLFAACLAGMGLCAIGSAIWILSADDPHLPHSREAIVARTSKPAMRDNRSRIYATVIKVDHRRKVRLRVDSVAPVPGYKSLAEPGRVITIRPFSDSSGTGSTMMLAEGDRVQAEVAWGGLYSDVGWHVLTWNTL